MAETLNQALASLGLTTRPSRYYGKKIIVDASGLELGHFDASEGWELVSRLRTERRAEYQRQAEVYAMQELGYLRNSEAA